MNSVGNLLFETCLKEITKVVKKQEVKDYVFSNASKAPIYNITDVWQKLFKKVCGNSLSNVLKVDNKEDLTSEDLFNLNELNLEALHTATGIKIGTFAEEDDEDSDGLVLFTDNTIFTEFLFTYADTTVKDNKSRTKKYFCTLYMNTETDLSAIVIFYITMKSDRISDININYSCMYKFNKEEVDGEPVLYMKEAGFTSIKNWLMIYVYENQMYKHMQASEILTMYTITILTYLCSLVGTFAMFRDLYNRNKSTYSCYIDNPTVNKPHYVRKDNHNTIKYYEKPIYLVLEDDKEKENKIHQYKRRDGKIEYAFSWIVRGHYRRMHNPKTWGKDKNGQDLQGATWIETYFKGNLDAPLRKREVKVLDRRTV